MLTIYLAVSKPIDILAICFHRKCKSRKRTFEPLNRNINRIWTEVRLIMNRNMLGGLPKKWVHMCIAKRNLLDISEIHATSFKPSRGFLMYPKWGCRWQEVPEYGLWGNGSYLTTFLKESPPRNGSYYVKTGGVLMPPKRGCGGQEVPEGDFWGHHSVPWIISNNFYKRISSQKWL